MDLCVYTFERWKKQRPVNEIASSFHGPCYITAIPILRKELSYWEILNETLVQ